MKNIMRFLKMKTIEPVVHEIILEKKFKFMYENFIISSQNNLFVLLEENNDVIDCICFDFSVYKYGYPNDEAGHPLVKYGLGIYGFFEVKKSTWIEEIKQNNQSHPSHSDSMYADQRHYIVKFKDITLEVISKAYELRQISKEEVLSMVNREIGYLRKKV